MFKIMILGQNGPNLGVVAFLFSEIFNFLWGAGRLNSQVRSLQQVADGTGLYLLEGFTTGQKQK